MKKYIPIQIKININKEELTLRTIIFSTIDLIFIFLGIFFLCTTDKSFNLTSLIHHAKNMSMKQLLSVMFLCAVIFSGWFMIYVAIKAINKRDKQKRENKL